MRYFILLLLIVSNVMALNDVTKPYNFSPRDTLKSSKFNANFDTLYNRINQNNDSTDEKFIRWYDFNSHDSTLRYFKVDTIRSNPNIDSIAGNTVITGAPIVTGALTVDSLKSTKGINATTGTFSGALTGATLNTGNGANELYPMDQDQRTTASPTHVLGTYTDGVRAYNATSSGSYVGLFKSQGALPGFSSSYFPVLKTDNSHLFFSTGGFYTAAMSNEYFAIPDSTRNRTKFYVYKDTTQMLIAKADSLKLGSGSYLKTYVEGTFACTLKTSDVTVQQVGNAYYTMIGNIVTIAFPNITGTSNSAGMYLYCGSIPSLIEPTTYMSTSIAGITDNGASVVGGDVQYYSVAGKRFLIRKPGGFTSSGLKGLSGGVGTESISSKFPITYMK